MRRFIELFDWPADRHFAGTMVCGGVGWLVALVVTFANGWDASSMWIASVVSGACCALGFIPFKNCINSKSPDREDWPFYAANRDVARSLPSAARMNI